MGNADSSGFGLEFWTIRLAEVQNELTKMTGRPGFSLGAMKIDESENYTRLRGLQLECEGKIEALGGGDAGTRNGRVVGTNHGI